MEAASFLGIGVRDVSALVRSGKLRARRIRANGHARISGQALIDYSTGADGYEAGNQSQNVHARILRKCGA